MGGVYVTKRQNCTVRSLITKMSGHAEIHVARMIPWYLEYADDMDQLPENLMQPLQMVCLKTGLTTSSEKIKNISVYPAFKFQLRYQNMWY